MQLHHGTCSKFIHFVLIFLPGGNVLGGSVGVGGLFSDKDKNEGTVSENSNANATLVLDEYKQN